MPNFVVLFSWRWWNNEICKYNKTLYWSCRGKKRLTIEHLQSEYGICERTLRYYQATMNEVLIVKDLQVVIINGVMQVIKAKAIK